MQTLVRSTGKHCWPAPVAKLCTNNWISQYLGDDNSTLHYF